MKIAVVNGTPARGITFHMKRMLLEALGEGNSIWEFYPEQLPAFCTGCKSCFLRGEACCPHEKAVKPIWEAMMGADLLVFAYPVYALRAPASIKSLLDHLCVHWMVHRPEPEMFSKTAIILTNSVGAPNQAAQKDVRTSLSWLGVSRIYACGAKMMGDIFWESLSDQHYKMLERKTKNVARRALSARAAAIGMSAKVALYFKMSKILHQRNLNAEDEPSLDNRFYLEKGWIKRKNPK